MVVYEVSDPAEFQDSNMEADPNTLVFVLFYQSNHDKHVREIVERLAESPAFATSVRFHANDVEDSLELAEEYHIKHFPTCLMLKSGQVVEKLVTPRDEEVIRERIEKNK